MENDVKKTQTWENQNLGFPVPFPLYPWLKIAFEYSVSYAYFYFKERACVTDDLFISLACSPTTFELIR